MSLVEEVNEQEFKGELVSVLCSAWKCADCRTTVLDVAQLDTLRVRTADAYRSKNRLLTSYQIRGRRQALNLSQREFADFLGVSPASIPRWESWQVQDTNYDRIIRAKTDNICLLEERSVNWVPSASLTKEFVKSLLGGLWSAPKSGFNFSLFAASDLGEAGIKMRDLDSVSLSNADRVLGKVHVSGGYAQETFYEAEPLAA